MTIEATNINWQDFDSKISKKLTPKNRDANCCPSCKNNFFIRKDKKCPNCFIELSLNSEPTSDDGWKRTKTKWIKGDEYKRLKSNKKKMAGWKVNRIKDTLNLTIVPESEVRRIKGRFRRTVEVVSGYRNQGGGNYWNPEISFKKDMAYKINSALKTKRVKFLSEMTDEEKQKIESDYESKIITEKKYPEPIEKNIGSILIICCKELKKPFYKRTCRDLSRYFHEKGALTESQKNFLFKIYNYITKANPYWEADKIKNG